MKTVVIITGANAENEIETMKQSELGCICNSVFFNTKKEADEMIERAYINTDNKDTIEISLLVQEDQPCFKIKKVYQSLINQDIYLQEIFL